jgi:sulfate permease, SulP family
MHLPRKILVAVACTEADGALLDYAAMLAGLFTGASVQLAHVLPEGARKEDAIRQLEPRMPDALRAASCTILEGDRLDALLRFAAAERVDVVVLGHRQARSGRRSLAKRLAMKAPCSVWLVPEGCAPRLGEMLVPVDYSERAADALAMGTAIGAAAGLERCWTLHVRFNGAAATFDEYADIELAGDEEAFAIFQARIDLHGLDVCPVFEESSNVARTILRVAGEKNCDLIIMGTRGRSPAASVLLGSETEQVLIETSVPVLAVKHYGSRLRLLQVLLEDRFRRRGDLRFT